MRQLKLSMTRLWASLVLLLVLPLLALPARADEGDLDEIANYVVTVDPRADGTADITYEIDWNVIGGSADEPLSWVKIGLPNPHNDSLENLTPDTVSDVRAMNGEGAFAKVVFTNRYYAPDVAAANGQKSNVHFAFRVHQSHLFLLNGEGGADYAFTPGWFEDLCVKQLTIRWRAVDGMTAEDGALENGYYVWTFQNLGHGERVTVSVTLPAESAAGLDPNAAAAANEMYYEEDDSGDALLIGFLIVFVLVLMLVLLNTRRATWEGGFGEEDPDDWLWYSNGAHVIHVARTLPPPAGYHPVDPPANFRAGGGTTRGGGAGRRSGTSNPSGCACACACVSSCACACACAGGGRAGCSAKNFYRITVTASRDADREETPHEP